MRRLQETEPINETSGRLHVSEVSLKIPCVKERGYKYFILFYCPQIPLKDHNQVFSALMGLMDERKVKHLELKFVTQHEGMFFTLYHLSSALSLSCHLSSSSSLSSFPS